MWLRTIGRAAYGQSLRCRRCSPGRAFGEFLRNVGIRLERILHLEQRDGPLRFGILGHGPLHATVAANAATAATAATVAIAAATAATVAIATVAIACDQLAATGCKLSSFGIAVTAATRLSAAGCGRK